MELVTQHPIERVLIVGAGWVGRQIAARMGGFGLSVWLTDRDTQTIEEALTWISRLPSKPLEGVRSAGPIAELVNSPQSQSGTEDASAEVETPAKRFDLVLECVPEQVSLKKRVLRQVSQRFPPPCIIASNSSYFVPSILCDFVESPQRFAHLHFHVPVLRESVADIVGCPATDAEVIGRLVALCQRVEQYPLRLRHEHPGYVFNWLLQAVLKAALELVQRDVVDPEDVDRSWKSVTHMPLGPFGIMDRIGLDVIEQVLANARWNDVPPASEAELMEVLRPLLDAGRLGVKTRAGFYRYEDDQLHQ